MFINLNKGISKNKYNMSLLKKGVDLIFWIIILDYVEKNMKVFGYHNIENTHTFESKLVFK